MPALDIDAVRRALEARKPTIVTPTDGEKCASVVLVLRNGRAGMLEALYIKRAENERDRWSGQVAFPGGRKEPGESPRETAVRECFEEVGLDLNDAAEFSEIGRLNDRRIGGLPGSALKSMVISTFVFFQTVPRPLPFSLQWSEVAAVIWAPLGTLTRAALDPSKYIAPQYMAQYTKGVVGRTTGLATLRFVSIELTGSVFPEPPLGSGAPPARFVLWGLTLGITSELLACVGRERLDVPFVHCERGVLMNGCITAAYWALGRLPPWNADRPPPSFLTVIKLSLALYGLAVSGAAYVAGAVALSQLGLVDHRVWGVSTAVDHVRRALLGPRGPADDGPTPRRARL